MSSKSMFIWVFEALVQKGVFYFTGGSDIAFLDILAYSGYKFFHLCLIMLVELFFGYFPSYVMMGILWISYSYFFFMTLKRFTPAHTAANMLYEGSLNRKTFMLINCACQCAVMWVLTWH